MTHKFSIRNILGADASCAKFPDAVMTMSFFFDNVVGLSRASARFAAALVRAGILTALERLASKQLEHSSEAANHVAGADAGDSIAEIEEVVMNCCAAFGRAVPRVSRRNAPAGHFRCGCLFAHVQRPIKTRCVQAWHIQYQAVMVYSHCYCRHKPIPVLLRYVNN